LKIDKEKSEKWRTQLRLRGDLVRNLQDHNTFVRATVDKETALLDLVFTLNAHMNPLP